MVRSTGGRSTHGESRLVVEDLLDAGDDLGGELGVDLKSLEVLDDLLGLGGSELSRGSAGHTHVTQTRIAPALRGCGVTGKDAIALLSR